MYSLTSIGRNLPRSQHLKPLAAFVRFQKTKASPLESEPGHENNDSAKPDPENNFVRPFEDIPGPERNLKTIAEFYVKSERFTKGYKMWDDLFEKYGPIFKEHMLFPFPSVHLLDPDDHEKVLRAEGKYPSRPIVDFWLEHRKRRNYFPGILLLEGEEWHRVRRGVAPKMMRPKIVEENIDNFNAVTKDAIARLVKIKESCGPDEHIPDLEGEMKRWATEGAGILAFDARLGLYEDPPTEEAMKFIQGMHDFLLLSHQLFFSVSYRMAQRFNIDTPKLKKFFKTADVLIEIGEIFVDKKMRELKEMAEKGIDPSEETQVVPLLTYLLAKKELTPEEVVAVAIDVIAAGVDTTSNSLLWLLYNLARNPHAQEKLYQEVESVVGKDGDVTSQSLAKLSYLKACVKESMRLNPVIPTNGRILDQDIVLSGYNVPAKTFINLETYCIARSEKYFQDALEFKPERWLRENRNEAHAFSSLPFGFGPRSCIGRRVAELEMYLFICKLLQRFQLEYHHDPLEMYQKIFMVPDKPVKINFIDRH
ncbi:cytochrome P450 10-like [Oculina patagonica]